MQLMFKISSNLEIYLHIAQEHTLLVFLRFELIAPCVYNILRVPKERVKINKRW